jgi:hypothetical protein
MTGRGMIPQERRTGTRLSSEQETALGLPGTVTPRGLQLPGELTFEDWQSVGQTLQVIAGASLWWIGDWYLFGEDRFGESAAQAIGDDTGYSARTVQQAAWVSSRFPISSRLESVPWSTHMALAAVEDESERVRILELAAKERWTREQARERVRNRKAVVPAVTQDEGRSVDVGQYLLTLFEEKGLLIVQHRDRRTGMALDRAMFTDEALALVQDFLNGSAR